MAASPSLPVPTKKSVLIEAVEFAGPRRIGCQTHGSPFRLSAILRASLLPNSVALQVEILALRHQPLVLRRSHNGHRARLHATDRLLWACWSQLWTNWRPVSILVKPETVIGWQRQGFRLY
jgi:hypothetical protein